MINSSSKIIFIISLGFIPVIFREIFDASSLALGLVLYLALFAVLKINIFLNKKLFNMKFLFFLFILFLNSLIYFLIYLDFKTVMSFFILLFILITARNLANEMYLNGYFSNRDFVVVFYTLIFLAIISYFSSYYLSSLFYERAKGIFPFGEPSNFALFFGPFFLLYLFQLPNFLKQFLVILSVSLLAVSIESTTLLIYVALALLLFVRINTISLYLVVPLSIYGVYYVLNDPYFLSRVILTPDSGNLTALVYLQGLTDAYNALVDTNGLGLGFQMLGTQPPSEIFYQIQTVMGQGLDGGGLNRKDGGFVAAKLVAEFGVIGIILLIAYLYLFFKVFLKLRRLIRVPNGFEPAYIFSLVFIYASFVEIFGRGVGYFSPSLFLFFTALFINSYYKKRVKGFAPKYS